MTTATLARDAFMPRAPAGLGRGLMLALIAHLLLVTALSFSTNWRISTPEGVEAELWAAVPQIAAPRPAPPEPETEPKPPTPTQPTVKPTPRPDPVKPVAKAPPVPDAQIATEKAKRIEDKRKKDAAEQAAADKLAKQRQASDAAKLAEQKRKLALTTQAKEEAALAKAREAQMQRIASLAGATGASNATGNALKSAGPSASYIGRIKGRIRPNVSFPDTITGNPKVEIEIAVAPDGRIMSSRIVRASGVPEWDDAVKRGIDKTAVLPRDETGRVTSPMTIVYSLRE